MPLASPRVRSVLPLALVAGLAAAVVGCGGGDGVSSYTVPKTTESGRGAPEPEPAAGGEYRILGAMYPADAPEWFFKMSGPADALAKHEADFDKILASVAVPPNGKPEFVTPDGWTPGKPRQFVVATLRTPDGKHELTVTSASGTVDANLKRWAVEQLGAQGYDAAKATRVVEGKGVKGLRADLRGPNNPTGKGGPMMGGK